MNKNSFEPNFTANGWYSFTMTVADIKAACTKHSIREDILEKAVLLAIQKQIALVATLSEAIEELNLVTLNALTASSTSKSATVMSLSVAT